MNSSLVVLRRAQCIAAIVCRGGIEYAEEWFNADALVAEMLEWIGDQGLVDALEPWESKVLETKTGQLAKLDTFQATWAAEGLAVLAWALYLAPIPVMDQLVDPVALAQSVGLPQAGALHSPSSCRLRTPDELSALRELHYDIHCRLRLALRNPEPMQSTRWLDPSGLELLSMTVDDLLAGDDLRVGALPVSQAERELILQRENAMRERHRASIWLSEREEGYWETHVDT
jgi:hypothetical protein